MPPAPIIYLDNAASTRVAPEVIEVVRACMDEDYGNPSSAHHAGIAAERRVRDATRALGAAIGDPDATLGELVWTSGGTEGDALGVIGAARARKGRGRHVVISAIEHPAVRESAQLLVRDGWKVSVVPAAPTGAIDPAAVVAAVGGEPAVVALMLVNNEIGTVQPVAEVAAALRGRDVHLHCDAVQGLGKVPIDVGALGADTVAFAAHKLHGPKGVGALWVRKGVRLEPLWAGGGQQGGLRSGTLNVPGIAGMGAAARLAVGALADNRARWSGFAEQLRAAAARTGVDWRENGAGAPRAPHVLSLAFAGAPAEPLLHVLESRGVLVSAGSACAEKNRKPSPVLQAIGLPERFGTLRLSFGRDTSADDVARAADILVAAVADVMR